MKRIPSQIRALQRLLDTGMRIDMIAEPLHSVDADAQAVEIAIVLEEHGFNECGVKRDGTVNEIVSRASLNKGTVGDHARPVPRERIVDAAAPLWSSLQPITQHGSLFVSGRHGLEGIATVADLNKQPARLLMFGIVSMHEMVLSALIGSHFTDDTWRAHLDDKRVEKAEEFQQQRERKNQQLKLVDCLQLCDKSCICLEIPGISKAWDLGKKKAERLFRRLQDIRDNLAHAHSAVVRGSWRKTIEALQQGHAILDKSLELLPKARPTT